MRSVMRRIAMWLVEMNASPDAAALDREEQRQKEALREKLNGIREQLETIITLTGNDRRRFPRSETR